MLISNSIETKGTFQTCTADIRMCFSFWLGNMRYFKITQTVVGGEVDGANMRVRSAIKLVSFISDNCQTKGT